MWVQLAIAVISMIISYALQAANKPKVQPPTAGTLDVPTPDPGATIGVLFGTNIVKNSNVLWYGDARVVPIQKSGGKK